jgi:hypothetical protein
MEQGSSTNIPSSLSQLIDNIKALQLTRSQGLPPFPPGYVAQLHGVQCLSEGTSDIRTSVQGMSPKKLHEVSVMTAHIVHQLRTTPALKGVRHVVDIGAGQVNASH